MLINQNSHSTVKSFTHLFNTVQFKCTGHAIAFIIPVLLDIPQTITKFTRDQYEKTAGTEARHTVPAANQQHKHITRIMKTTAGNNRK